MLVTSSTKRNGEKEPKQAWGPGRRGLKDTHEVPKAPGSALASVTFETLPTALVLALGSEMGGD